MFQCAVCQHVSRSLKAYVRHYRFHANLSNITFTCGVTECNRDFRSYNAFNVHTTRIHKEQRFDERVARQISVEDINLVCQLQNCQQNCIDFACLLSHMKSHIDNGYEISCPFLSCNKKYRVKSSFTSHITRIHRSTESINVPVPSTDMPPSTSSEMSTHSIDGRDDLGETNSCNVSEEESHECGSADEEDESSIEELYVHNMALFYLRLQTKHHVPASTLQVIVDELNSIQNIQSRHLEILLKSKLSSAGLEKCVISQILEDMECKNLFTAAHKKVTGPLRSNFTRKEYYKHNMSYVEPVAMKLGTDDTNTSRHFHYVPIKSSIEALFKDISVQEQYLNPLQRQDGVFSDFTDGSMFKRIELFTRLQGGLQLILYQDAFEIVNPLGSAKKKHKIVAVYYTLGNLYPYNRSKIDPIQLVALCKNKDLQFFGQERIFSRLVKDLKEIEDFGIDIGVGHNIKGAVVCILGDNLGSHYLGGFLENFSSAQYMCRYCKIQKDDMFSGNLESQRTAERRTPENYNEALQYLEQTRNREQTSYEGIKQNSVFNELRYFHVCNPGLPPCIGHDLFEGIVQYDMAIFIKYLVKEKRWFTYEQINTTLKHFKLLGSDSLDKPNNVNSNGLKLGGHAVQNWIFLRIFPMIVFNRIQDFNDQVWNLILLLRQIVELVCAPHISTGQIAYLNVLIEEYITLRIKKFSDVRLRPKHHYLMHYPELILQFGPLIRLWTMRMESKHTFFKWCTRSSKNFLNVTYSLAETHQLLQAFHNAGFLFGKPVQLDDKAIVFCVELYNEGIQQAVSSFQFLHTHSLTSNSVVIHGTKYSKGMYVVIDKVDGDLLLGEILCVIVSGTEHPYFIVHLCKCIFLNDVGLYKVIDARQDGNIKCVDADKLLDYHPLCGYRLQGNVLIALKHAVVDLELHVAQ